MNRFGLIAGLAIAVLLPAAAIADDQHVIRARSHATRRFCTRSALVHGAEMVERRGRTSGFVARRGPRLPRRTCATTFEGAGANNRKVR
jgi:hypothetical protein